MKNLISLLFIASLIVIGYTIYELTRTPIDRFLSKLERSGILDKIDVLKVMRIDHKANDTIIGDGGNGVKYYPCKFKIRPMSIIFAKHDTVIYHPFDIMERHFFNGTITVNKDSITLYKGTVIGFAEKIIPYGDLSKGVKASHVYVDNPTNNIVWTKPTKNN